MKRILAGLLSASALAALATAGAAQDITLRMGTFIPATNNGVTQGDQIFMDEVTRLTEGKVKIEYYPAQQAGQAREALELVRNGAVDIYGLGTAYFSADAPLWGLLEAPNLIQNVCDGTHAMRAIGDPGGILWTAMYEPLGIRILSHQVYPPYGPSASHTEITEVEQLNGLKVRNAGGLMERSTAALGAIPVSLTGPEVLQALERGTLDSWMGAYSSVRDYEYYKFTKYGVTGFSLGTPGIFAAISEAKFQSLPKDVQDALVEAGKAAEEHFCAFMEKDEKEAIQALQTPEYGMTIYTWTPEQVAQMSEMTKGVVDGWITDLEARGVPARQAMDDYVAAIGK